MARELLGLPKDKKILLAGASGLSLTGGRKGEEYLFDAFSRVRQSIPDVHLALFGTSRAPEDIPCTALGIIQDERLLALAYSAADLFISTSLEDNLPNTVLEALACGLPVVGFAIEGILDAVDHGQTGLLSAPGDAASLAIQIANGLLDNDSRQRMAHRARQIALTRFDARRQGADYADLLQELCAARAVRSAGSPSNRNHLDSAGSNVSHPGKKEI
jgi:glycosyltransferase involved in cell wall biosynthesis